MAAGDITRYTDLVTSEHNDKPDFMAWLSALVQPYADMVATLRTVQGLYDLDLAVGTQLDVVGQWIGVSRQIQTELPNVYFTLGDPALGFGLGVWRQPFESGFGLTVLPDDHYRVLLKARVASNHWDGTIPGAYMVWTTVFAAEGLVIVIQDNQDMTMTIGLVDGGATIDPLTKALLTGGYLDLRPAGVGIAAYFIPSVPDNPFFGFGAQNDVIAGFGTGAWAQHLT